MLDALKYLILPPAVASEISVGLRSYLPVLSEDLRHGNVSKVVLGAHV